MNLNYKDKNGLTEEEFLKQYNPKDYDRPSVTSDILIFKMGTNLNGLKILLIKRGGHPYINCWALPGGFVNIDESTFTAANRELKEETGIENIYLEQLYTYSNPTRDPRSRVISVAYMALVPTTKDVKAGDDASDAAWFDIKMDDKTMVLSNKEKDIEIKYSLCSQEFTCGHITYENSVPDLISEERLAFDHQLIIYDGLMRLRNKVEYSNIAFNLVGEEFTLPDLQRVYEVILGKKLYKTNFRDKIEDKIVVTDEKKVSITGNKLSTVYKFKK
ncbi:MAG: NUDIX hydrolase [Bacilli bacterium]|nr:NUDIX hydrolase [Bacilli bacterium]